MGATTTRSDISLLKLYAYFVLPPVLATATVAVAAEIAIAFVAQ
jgi:hypothetical protein